jgi:hypothetical protein
MKSFMAFWKSSQKDKKAQKNKRKCSDNDTSDSEQNYSTSFQLVASKTKRAKIGIPRTEIIGETTVNISKKPVRILIWMSVLLRTMAANALEAGTDNGQWRTLIAVLVARLKEDVAHGGRRLWRLLP